MTKLLARTAVLLFFFVASLVSGMVVIWGTAACVGFVIAVCVNGFDAGWNFLNTLI